MADIYNDPSPEDLAELAKGNTSPWAPLAQGGGGQISDLVSPRGIRASQEALATLKQGGGGGEPTAPAPAKTAGGVSSTALSILKNIVAPGAGVQEGIQQVANAFSNADARTQPGRVPMLRPGQLASNEPPSFITGDNVSLAKEGGGTLAIAVIKPDGTTGWVAAPELHENWKAYKESGISLAPSNGHLVSMLSRVIPAASLNTLDLATPWFAALDKKAGGDERDLSDIRNQFAGSERAQREARAVVNPKSTFTGEFAGGLAAAASGTGIAGAVPKVGSAAAPLWKEGASLISNIGNVARKAGTTVANAAVQPAVYGAGGGVQAGAESLAAGEDVGTALEKAKTGAELGAATTVGANVVGKVFHDVGAAALGGPVSEKGIREHILDSLVRKEAQKRGISYEEARQALIASEERGTAGQANIPGFKPTIASTNPENATLAQFYNTAAAHRGTLGQQLAEAEEANSRALTAHLLNQTEGDTAIKTAEMNLKRTGDTLYENARNAYEQKMQNAIDAAKANPNDPKLAAEVERFRTEQQTHALQFAHLVEKDPVIRDARKEVAQGLKQDIEHNNAQKMRAEQAAGISATPPEQPQLSSIDIHNEMTRSGSTFEQAVAKLSEEQRMGLVKAPENLPGWEPLPVSHGSPPDILHRVRKHLDDLITLEPSALNIRRIKARNEINKQLKHISPEYKEADATWSAERNRIDQMISANEAVKTVAPAGEISRPTLTKVRQAREGAVYEKGPMEGQNALTPEQTKAFQDVETELAKRQEYARKGIAPGGGPATAGRLKETAESSGARDIINIMAGDLLAGGKGKITAGVLGTKWLASRLWGNNEYKALHEILTGNATERASAFRALDPHRQSAVQNVLREATASYVRTEHPQTPESDLSGLTQPYVDELSNLQ